MTKDEAITAVKEVTGMSLPWDDRHYEALQMAIEALHQFDEDSKKVYAEGRHKKDLISKADVCEILADVFPTDGEKVVFVEDIENAYQEIIALPYIQPFVIHCTDCEDWYKRQSVWNVAISALPPAQPKRTQERTETHSCDLISRQAAIDALAKNMPSLTTPDGCGEFDHDIQVTDEAYVDCMQIIHELPSAQPETYKEKLKEIADALSEKFAYMNTCLNERDIILGYLGVSRPSKTHCNTDCTNIKCESYRYNKRLPPAQPDIIRCGECRHLHDNDCPVVGWGRDDDDYCAWAERDNDE